MMRLSLRHFAQPCIRALHDLVHRIHWRNDTSARVACRPYHDNSYAVGEKLARKLRGDESNGIVYLYAE